MKTSVLLWAILPLMMTAQIQAKELQALLCKATFFSEVQGPYVETYLEVFGSSATYIKAPDGAFQASLQVTMLFKIGDKIVDFRKYNLLSAGVEDTLQELPNFIDQQRIPLPYGVYRLEMSLADNNSNDKPIRDTCTVAVEFDRENLKFSDFQFVESFRPTEQDNILSKSGFDLIPYLSDFFPASVDVMNFYTEVYNLDKKIGVSEDFLFRYYIESSKDLIIMDDFIKFQRQKSAAVNPLLVTIPITDLPNGDYNLVVETVDRNNALLARHKTGFQRVNPGLQLSESDIKAVDITATFAEKITSLDSLRFYLKSLAPIGTMRQNQYMDKVVKTDDIRQMQKFLYGFWKTRNDEYPESEWNNYKAQVLAIEEFYKTKIKHGFETDMGYTWLKYGTPNEVEDSKHEPSAVPYIIWKYWHIENQSNVRFVFNNPHLVGTEYFLLYSDARDERFDTGPGKSMYDRTSGFGSQGGFGSRYSSNFKR